MASKRIKALQHSISLEQSSPTVLAIMESMRSMYREGVLSDEDVWDATKTFLPQFTRRVHLAFQLKKLLEASGMVFRFHSLQVTFFGISQSDCMKKISSHGEKKTRCEVKLTTPN